MLHVVSTSDRSRRFLGCTCKVEAIVVGQLLSEGLHGASLRQVLPRRDLVGLVDPELQLNALGGVQRLHSEVEVGWWRWRWRCGSGGWCRRGTSCSW